MGADFSKGLKAACFHYWDLIFRCSPSTTLVFYGDGCLSEALLNAAHSEVFKTDECLSCWLL